MSYTELKRILRSTQALERFNKLYGIRDVGYTYQMSRYTQIVKLHEDVFNNEAGLCVVSSPGRCEVVGNHTDHNQGIVLAAAINLDALACVAMRDDNIVRLNSEGYGMVEVNLDHLVPDPAEEGTTAALIRGVAAGMQKHGFKIGGFDAAVTSDVLSGSGMSSSAAFEVLICAILDQLYNGFTMDSTLRAQISQYAENVFFMKPSGLMDQMACSTGGLVGIDFKNPEPEVTPIHYAFADKGYALVVINTGGSHDDLTADYAAIPNEMLAVASYFGEQSLRRVRKEQILQEMHTLRENAGDRAVLRALHYYAENDRSLHAMKALVEDDVEAFLQVIRQSGISSWTLLQNVSLLSAENQPLAISLALADTLLAGKGVSRIHGGGFAGTTLHFVPLDMVDTFTSEMNKVFGDNASHVVDVRDEGAFVVFS